MRKYLKVSGFYDSEIEEIEIERETEKCIFIGGFRSNKRSESKWSDNYFTTFSEAKAFKIKTLEKAIKGKLFSIECAEREIKNYKAELEKTINL